MGAHGGTVGKVEAEAFLVAASVRKEAHDFMAAASSKKRPAEDDACKDDKRGINMDKRRWSETFWMMQKAGHLDRSNTYALTVATLKQKGDEIQHSIDALRAAEGNLMKAAKDEVDEAL